MTEAMQRRHEPDAIVDAAMAGDEEAFSELAERYRSELQAHCHRMLRSREDPEDLVQETLLRAWGRRATFQGRSSFRTWLYRIATNACLDAIQRRPRRPQVAESPELASTLLDGLEANDPEPDAAVVSKETMELAVMVAIRHLPPRQRAVLILRSVLGCSAKDSASLLEDSVASVNSALQRARRTLRQRLADHRLEWAPESDPSPEQRALVRLYLEAIERADADAFLETLRQERPLGWSPKGHRGGR